MLSFFATSEGGLTVPGYVAVAIVLFLVLIISSVIGNKKRKFRHNTNNFYGRAFS